MVGLLNRFGARSWNTRQGRNMTLKKQPPQTSVTVEMVLRLPVLRRGAPEVVTSEAPLDNVIRWVHAGEVSNMAALLKGGELLLTTGMGIGNGDAHERRFVAGLAARGLAGIVLELGGTYDAPPPAMVTEADRAGLPLVALHKEVPFVEITEEVHRAIVSAQFAVLERSEEAHHRFTGLSLEGAGIPEILTVLAEAISNPAILARENGEIVYHVPHLSADSEILGAWESLQRGQGGTFDSVEAIVPTAGGRRWGRLVAFGLEGPIDDFDRVSVERAAEVVALTLLRGQQEDALSARRRGDFLVGLLRRDFDDHEAAQLAAASGFDGAPPYLLPLVVLRARRDSLALPDETSWATVVRAIHRELAGRRVPVVAGLNRADSEALVIVGLQEPERRAAVCDEVARVVRREAENLGISAAVTVCAGAVAEGWANARDSLQQALEGAAAARAAPPQVWHDLVRPDLYRLLWSLCDNSPLRQFTEHRLEALLKYDRRRNSELVPTLEALFRNGGNKADTARELHLERQSLYHRLERIESIIGESIGDEDVRLGLHLAVRARNVMHPR